MSEADAQQKLDAMLDIVFMVILLWVLLVALFVLLEHYCRHRQYCLGHPLCISTFPLPSNHSSYLFLLRLCVPASMLFPCDDLLAADGIHVSGVAQCPGSGNLAFSSGGHVPTPADNLTPHIMTLEMSLLATSLTFACCSAGVWRFCLSHHLASPCCACVCCLCFCGCHTSGCHGLQ